MRKLYMSQIAAYVAKLTGKAQQIIVTKDHPELPYSSYGDADIPQRPQPMILVCDKDITVESILWTADHGLYLNAQYGGLSWQQIQHNGAKAHVLLWDTDCEVGRDGQGIFVSEAGAINGVLVFYDCYHLDPDGVSPSQYDTGLIRRYDIQRPENRVWIYNRVGSDAAAMAQNEKLLYGYAVQNGFTIAGTTSELGPGASLHRPGIQELYKAAEESRFDILLTTRADRLCRTLGKWSALQYFTSRGLSVKCIKEDLCIHSGNIDRLRVSPQAMRMAQRSDSPQFMGYTY